MFFCLSVVCLFVCFFVAVVGGVFVFDAVGSVVVVVGGGGVVVAVDVVVVVVVVCVFVCFWC